jgi:hypothetical protein
MELHGTEFPECFINLYNPSDHAIKVVVLVDDIEFIDHRGHVARESRSIRPTVF